MDAVQEAVVTPESHQSPSRDRKQKLRLLSERYPNLKPNQVPARLIEMSFDEIESLEKQLLDKYGFASQELKFVMRHKPTFVLDQDSEETGIKVVYDYFVTKHGYTPEFVKTIVVKYPFILSKTEE